MRIGQAELVAGVVSFALAAGTLGLTGPDRAVAVIWPANAVLLALMLERRPGAWPGVLALGMLASVAADGLMRGVSLGSVLHAACSLVELCLAAALLRRPGPRDEGLLDAPSAVGRFIAVCGGVAPALSGIGAAVTARLLFRQDPGASFAVWFLGDGLGLLIVTPFVRALLRGGHRRDFAARSGWRRAEAAGLLALTAASAYAVFFVAPRPLMFVLFCPVMLATFRIGRRGTELAVMIVALIGTVATLGGEGPIATPGADPRERALLLQIFLAGLLLTCLPVAAALAARGESLAALSRSAEALRAQGAELARLAATDDLTGALNRAAFRDAALQVIRDSAIRDSAMRIPAHAPLSLIAIDLDLFKAVNDRHGHRAGDRALVHLVAVLRAGLREPDLVGRVGGDEFLVLLPGTDLDRADAIALRLRGALRRTPLALDDGAVLTLSMSCGTAPYRDGMSFEDFVHAADTALYRDKHAGREVARSA
ncbi:sensor domain-containing diguanylate cyclase [Methylobacterium terrae]|uniref:diguanylate cyclase n=1 Tax=Methylobacterium terrae TaxID=2202827 RepID=A0A2U8WT72_9HYPH|nr:diguanylate cyclase [Methylobacterium terrae]AWN49409.1 sensor domain-containing diguanylate cyclase [Methylobacterium terrae]